MTTAWNQPYRLMIILTIVVGMLTSCTSVLQHLDDEMHRKQFKSDYAALENALAVYDEGDFQKARTQFKALHMVSASQKIARKARLGEICCNLMLANTQSQSSTAIGMWHDFAKSAPENDAVWDRVLLDPLIVRPRPKKITLVIETDPPADQTSAGTAAPPDTQHDDGQLRAEIAALKKKVKDAEQLQLQLEAVAAENRSLREKITALEAIDQNIQKKKTEISAPSE